MKRGFTLAEILVVITILLILSSILLPRYYLFRQQLSLSRAAYKLAQDLRRAQEMATSARELEGGEVPPGYGVSLTSGATNYLLYADTNPAKGNEIYDGGDQIVENISLESGVKIQSVSPSPLSINFKGPDPCTTISGGADSVTITLSLENDPTKTKRVVVNQAGLIYVE